MFVTRNILTGAAQTSVVTVVKKCRKEGENNRSFI